MSVLHDSAVFVSPDPGERLRVVAEPGNLIDAAVEVLMARHRVSRDEAVDLLEQATDNRKRPLTEVAKDVILIGLPAVNTQIELRLSPLPEAMPGPPLPSPIPSAVNSPTDVGRSAAKGALIDTVAAGLLDLLVEMSSLPAMLEAISELAVDVVPGCTAATVMVIREGAPVTVASGNSRARQIDEAQYRNGEGPYLQATHTRRAIRLDDISAVPVREVWARIAQKAGFRATMAVPILSSADIAAVMSLYACHGTDWSSESLSIAETVADHAGNAIAIACRLTAPDATTR